MGFLTWLPRLDKCCFCVDLRTGAIVLGVLGTIGSLLSLVGMFLNNPLDEIKNNPNIDPEVREKLETLFTGIMIYSGIMYAISLVLAILLLIGSIKRNTTCLKIYVIVNMVLLFVLAGITVVLFIFAPAATISVIIMLLISAYYLFCINSYLQVLLDEENRVAPPQDPYKS